MAEPWKRGDRAKCVNVSDIRIPLRTIVAQGGRYLTLGAFYTVGGVETNHYGELCLEVGAQYGHKLARRFVKVPPDEESVERSAEAERKVPA